MKIAKKKEENKKKLLKKFFFSKKKAKGRKESITLSDDLLVCGAVSYSCAAGT